LSAYIKTKKTYSVEEENMRDHVLASAHYAKS